MTTKFRHRLKDVLWGSVLALAAGIIVAAFYIRLPHADAQETAVVQLRGTLTGPATVRLGGTLSYRIQVRNIGSTPIAGYQIQDVLPTGLVFESSSGGLCNPSGGTVTCEITQSLAPNQTHTLQLVLRLNEFDQCSCDCDLIFNEVTVNGSLRLGPVTTRIICQPAVVDLSIMKTGPTTALRGENILYNLTVLNLGDGPVSNVTVTDTFPGTMQFVSTTDPRCLNNGNTVICHLSEVPSNASTQISVTLRSIFDPNVRCSSMSISNTAKVESAIRERTTSNNTSTVRTTITCPASSSSRSSSSSSSSRSSSSSTGFSQLVGEKKGPKTVRLGGTLSYSIRVKNIGDGDSSTYTVEDAIPTGLTFSPAGSDDRCSLAGSTVICNGEPLRSNQSKSFRLKFLFTENDQCTCECDLIINSATINGSIPIDAWTTQIICEPAKVDIGVTKTGPVSTTYGETLTYKLIVKNYSEQDADTITVKDKLPADLHFVSATGAECSIGSKNELLCEIPTLEGGAETTIEVQTTVNMLPAEKRCTDKKIKNSVSVKSKLKDPVSKNNSSSISTSLLCPRSDISITKTGPISVTRGVPATYVIEVNNRGPAEARIVVIKDKLPKEFTFVGMTSDFVGTTGANCSLVKNEVLCRIEVLPVGRRSVSITLIAPVLEDKCSTKRFKNTATFTVTSVIDQNKVDNTSKLDGEILCTPLTTADLSIAKQGPSTATAFRGGSFFYKISVKNLGPGNATNVIVEDRVPDGLNFLTSFDAVCSSVGSIVRCNIGNLSKGESKQFRILFSAPPIERCNEVQIVNTATVHADQIDRKPKNNTTKNIITRLKCPRNNIDIKKTDDRTTVSACETLTYKITVKNKSGVPANEVTVVDTFPNYLRPVRASNGGQIIGQTVVWERLSLLSHATKNLSFVAEVRSDTPQKTVITNFVTTGAKRASDKTTVKGVCRSSSSSRSRTPVERLNDTVDEMVLPPTGAEADFYAPATNGKQFLVKVDTTVRPIATTKGSEKGLGVYAVISVALLALAVGIGLFLKAKK